MSHKLTALVDNLSNVFNKDPQPLDALSVAYPFGANWVIDKRVLSTVVPSNKTALRIELTGKTIQQVADAINAETNLLSNGDIDLPLTSTFNAFDDQFADLNAWSLTSGSTFTVASNLVSNAAGDNNRMLFGHKEWKDMSAGSRIRFTWVTGGVFFLLMHYIDVNNFTYWEVDGGNIRLKKHIAGVATTVNTTAAVLTNGNSYWLQPTITGSLYATTLDNDSAGAPGSNVVTISNQSIPDTNVAYGRMGVQMNGGTGMKMGGAFADVCLIKAPAPPGWAPFSSSGVPAYAVSDLTKQNGSYSLSIYNNHNTAYGNWIQTITVNSATISGYIKTESVALGGGGRGAIFQDMGDGIPASGDFSGTNDWTKREAFGEFDGLGGVGPSLRTASGYAWFDAIKVATPHDYSATVLNNTGNMSAYSLIEDQYPSQTGAAVIIPLHTSPLYQLLSSIAVTMDELDDDIVEAFEQVTLSQATSVWLDQWGKVYGTPRLPNEPDFLYARRINESVVAIKSNGPSIIAILKRVAGINSSITSEGPATFTIETVLSDEAQISSYSLGDISGMIRSWKTFGVIATINFTTLGSELYLATSGTDTLIDASIPNALGFQWGLPEFGLTEFG